MKILHLNYSDIDGGAARAAYRLNLALNEIGIDSSMLVLNKQSGDKTVIGPSSKAWKFINIIRLYLNLLLVKLQKSENSNLHSLNILPSNILDKINKINPDVVHLHWVCGETISIREISNIKFPIVWTMHDMWPLCGCEHYADLSTRRFEDGYSAINRPASLRGIDLNKIVWTLKFRYWKKKKNFIVVTPSSWLGNCVKNSPIFKEKSIHVISNALDLKKYFPIPRQTARSVLNIAANKKYILFGAQNSVVDKRKGFHLLIEAISLLDLPFEELEILIFGSRYLPEGLKVKYKMHFLGNLSDDISLNVLYSAADVFLCPSLIDNFPNTVCESLSSGTPVVAFNAGGLSDQIDHLQNGYLAKPYVVEDFSNGIKWVLNGHSETLRVNSRRKSEEYFEQSIVANQYLKVYQSFMKSV